MKYNILLLGIETIFFIFFTKYTYKSLYEILDYFKIYLPLKIMSILVFIVNLLAAIAIWMFFKENMIYGIYYGILSSILIILYSL